VSVKKVSSLIIVIALFIFFWDYNFLRPFKVFVVYIHEISHAIVSLLTGGEVHSISVEWNESGVTQTSAGNFVLTAVAGYMGSIVCGSILLYSGLSGRHERFVATFLGTTLLFFTVFYSESMNLTFFVIFLAIGGGTILIAAFFGKLNRLLLFLTGTLSSMYALFDLSDFFKGAVLKTDAGLIANHFIRDAKLQVLFAYAISFFISVFSIWLVTRVIAYAVAHKIEEIDFNEEDELELATPTMEKNNEYLADLNHGSEI